MKIKKFEQINESVSIKDYIENFDGGCDGGIIDWIHEISKTTMLKEYTNIYSKKFQEDKKLVAYTKFIGIEKKIEDAQKQIEKLEKSKEKLEINAKSEILYKFQEDLLENDTNSFYVLFIDGWDENDDGDYVYGETHPNIIKKYKNKLDLIIASKKYNL
jgi:hypothetical protein